MPKWQHPAPGDSLIQGTLNVRAVQPGAWLLAEATQLDPADGGTRTRLVNRMRIQAPGVNSRP